MKARRYTLISRVTLHIERVTYVGDPKETDGLRRIREQYEEDWKSLERERTFLGTEMDRLGAVYEECYRLLLDRDFHSLSAILSAEGFQSAGGLDLEQYLPEAFSPCFIKLVRESQRLDSTLDRLNAEIKTGVTCHRCVGMGTVMKERHYEREGQLKLVGKIEDCDLCGGSGRLRLDH